MKCPEKTQKGIKVKVLIKGKNFNKVGSIVEDCTKGAWVLLDFPVTKNYTSGQGFEYSLCCTWDEMEIFIQKNQQLLFSFMEG